MDTPVAYPHIEIDEEGTARVGGTRLKVLHLVAAQRAYGWSPEELHFQHPQLSLGQIHSALAYYWDHRERLDEELNERLRRVEALRAQTEEGDAGPRLRALKERL